MKVLPWFAAVVVAVGAVTIATGGGAVAADTPPPIEEDFSYPGADQILAQHGLKLIRGDGHILFVTSHKYGEQQCAAGEIQVEKWLDVDPYGVYYCFRTVGTQGFLTLEVPGTFGIRGGEQPLQATANLTDGQKTYAIAPNGFVAIDPGAGSELPQAVLVELRMPAAS